MGRAAGAAGAAAGSAGCGGARFLRFRRPRLGLLLRPPLGLGPAFLGGFLRTPRGNETDHGAALVLDPGLLLPAQREQQEHKQRFDQNGQAEAERAAAGHDTDPLDERDGWNGPRLKQWVFGIYVRGTRPEAMETRDSLASGPWQAGSPAKLVMLPASE